MFQAREVKGESHWLDLDGIKIYTVSADDGVDYQAFSLRLEEVKRQNCRDWANTPAFVIFHKGASLN